MDEDKIDASVNLAFSLELFKLHNLSGTLQAELPRVPGIPRHSIAILEIANGIIVSCTLMDKKGQRNSIAKEVLIQLDEERGPFGWGFQQSKPTRSGTHDSRSKQPDASVLPTFQNPSSFAGSDTFIPKIITQIDWRRLYNRTDQQRQTLYMVWQLIDGRRTTRDIKDALGASYPDAFVDEILRVLLDMKVIIIAKKE